MIYQQLFDRTPEPAIVSALLIGAGDFGTAIVTQSLYIPRLRFAAIADIDPEAAVRAYQRMGYDRPRIAVTCYLPFVDYSPPYYGALGTAILVVFALLVRDWARRRVLQSGAARIASDLRMAGVFFLVAATWSLCGIFGIVTYALQPQVMLARGLQSTAVTLTAHVMAELALGWFLLLLAARKEPRPRAVH